MNADERKCVSAFVYSAGNQNSKMPNGFHAVKPCSRLFLVRFTQWRPVMDELAKQRCEPCRIGAPTVTREEIEALKPQVPQWTIRNVDGINRLERTFTFDDYAQALAFTLRVGELAEQEGHHPATLTEWGRVTVSWWTHKIGGLHANDFVMAAKTDRMHAGPAKPACTRLSRGNRGQSHFSATSYVHAMGLLGETRRLIPMSLWLSHT